MRNSTSYSEGVIVGYMDLVRDVEGFVRLCRGYVKPSQTPEGIGRFEGEYEQTEMFVECPELRDYLRSIVSYLIASR